MTYETTGDLFLRCTFGCRAGRTGKSLRLPLPGMPTADGVCFRDRCFFANEAVETFGFTTSFSRLGASGKTIEFHFCPSCGSTVFWKPAFRLGMTAVAFGCFEVKDGLKPSQSVYDEHRHPWIGIETT